VILIAALAVAVGCYRFDVEGIHEGGRAGVGSDRSYYNLVVLLKIAGKPIWWVILFLIPLVSFVIAIRVCISLAENLARSRVRRRVGPARFYLLPGPGPLGMPVPGSLVRCADAA